MQTSPLKANKRRKQMLRRAGCTLVSRKRQSNDEEEGGRHQGNDKQESLVSLYAIFREETDVLSPSVNSDSSMLGPAAHRSVLLDVFLQALRPKGTREEVQTHIFHSAIQYLSSLDRFSPILTRAVDSLCLAYLGKQSGDPRITWSSQVYYGQVLASLREAVSTSDTLVRSFRPRDVLASIMLLGLYDCTPSIQRPCQTWETHLWGALQYLQMLGPECLDLSDPYDLKLLRNMYGPALALCLARRKALVFSLPKWTAVRRKLIVSAPQIDYFATVAKLPALLEQADLLLVSGTHHSVALYTNTLARFARFRNEIDVCLCATFMDDELCSVSTSDSTAFDLSIEEHIMITNSSTFDTFHRFRRKSEEMAKVKTATFCWLGSLLTETTVLRLLSHGPKEFQTAALIRDSRQRALDAADQLCRSVYVLSQLGSIAYANYTCVLLQVAGALYEDSGAARKMVWCQMCMGATKIRIERLRSICPPTLCRIGDLADSLTAAVRCERIGAWGPPF